MTPKPLVSIIVPTFNRRDLLLRALKSISVQMYAYHETIVVNDGGEDVSKMVSGFHKARYINLGRNYGLPAARNAGIREAKGEWIAYLDDDDWYYPHHLRRLVAMAEQARFIYSNADYVNRFGHVKLYMDVDPTADILEHNITPVCCVIHDRKLIDQAGWFDETLQNHEDWDLWIRMSKITKMYHLKETTCCIDRSHLTMNSDTQAMMQGFKEVQCRYQCHESRSTA